MRWGICFLFASVVAAQQTTSQPSTLGLIEGRVVHAFTGEPIRKAHVTLESSATEHDSALVATTDETGHFQFAGVDQGVYRLTAEKTGFVGGSYGQATYEDASTLLKVSAGDNVRDLTLRLFPAGAISGRVLDPDGDPAPGYEVVLWARHARRRNIPYTASDQTTTNQVGEYRFEGLMPDTYYVSASKESSGLAVREIPVDGEGRTTKLHELDTFYPAALSLLESQAIRIDIGQEQSGTDIRIQRGSLLTVKGRIAGAIDSLSKYEVSASIEEGEGWTSEAAKVLPDGEFVIELSPGKHQLSLLEEGGSGLKKIGSTEINLVDQDVSGVVIARFKPAQVRVRVVMEGEEDKPLTKGSVFLTPNDWDASSRNGLSEYQPQNGTYVIEGVPPGKYWVLFNNASGCYLKSVQAGGRALDPQLIEVTEGVSLDLLLTYSKNVASVNGSIEARQDQRRPSRVLLISEDAVSPGDKIYPLKLDQSLHFSIEHVRPGKYLAVASQEDDFDLWDNADFVKSLQSEGVEVELHENEHATLHLKLIAKEQTDSVRKRLGL